jgi:ribosome-associated protein
MVGDMEQREGRVTTPGGREIAAAAVEWEATRSGGPGGQHANTSETAVTVTIDVAGSGLPDAILNRVLERAGPTITATSSDSRSQWRNRKLAWERAAALLDEAARPPAPPRRRTRPSKASQQARLDAKRQAAERKQQRRKPAVDDE